MNDNTSALSLVTPEPEEDRANRTLLKLLRLAHTMTPEERELALVMLQAVTAWSGLRESA